MKRIRGRFHPQSLLKNLIQVSGIIVSVILLVICVFLYLAFQNNQPQTTEILIAGQTIPAQDPVTAEHLATYAIPNKQLPPNSITKADAEEIVGLEVIHPVHKGDIIQRSSFGIHDDGDHHGIAAIIPTDKQLVYLRFSEVYIFPPDIQKGNALRIRAVEQDTNESVLIIPSVEIFDIYRTVVDEEEQIAMISFLLTEEETVQLSPFLNDKWQIYLTVLSDEQNDDEIQATTSSQLEQQTDQDVNATESGILEVEPDNEDE